MNSRIPLIEIAIAVSVLGLMFAPLSTVSASTAQMSQPPLAKAANPVPVVFPVRVMFTAHLSGMIPYTDSLARGQAVFTVSPDGTMMGFWLVVANIQDVTMAHIHIMLPDDSTAVVVWLYPSAPPPREIPGMFSGVLAHGTFTAADFVGPLAGMTMGTLIGYMMSGNAFVMVHTAESPGGEIMGPIIPIHSPIVGGMGIMGKSPPELV